MEDNQYDEVGRAFLGVPADTEGPIGTEPIFRYLSAAVRVLHELSVRLTGGGFTLHDIGGKGLDIHSSMTRPIRVTFDSAKNWFSRKLVNQDEVDRLLAEGWSIVGRNNRGEYVAEQYNGIILDSEVEPDAGDAQRTSQA